jgi:hypothetical protein
MPTGELMQVDGAAAGAWIELRLDGWGGKVKQQIPQIYEAYARIFHPASDGKGNPVTWREVADALGTTAHREMQWHAIVGSYDYSNFTGSKWSGGNPNISELDEEPLAALCAILERHTSSPERCYFGISTIHGGVEEEFPDEPLLRMPNRDFAILAGPLSAVDQIGISNAHASAFSFSAVWVGDGPPPDPDPDPSTNASEMAPNLIWPENRAWFVASEYDFDSTLVGGSRELIDAILDSPDLEAWQVDPEVSLQADADKVNPVPDPPPGFDEPGDPDELQRSFFIETLQTLRGQVLDAGVTDSGILEIEIGGPGESRWRLTAENSEWSANLMALKSLTVEGVELDTKAGDLRCRLSDGSSLEIQPLDRQADDDPPNWRIETPFGLTLKHGPGLLVDFHGLEESTFEGRRSGSGH